MYLSALEVGRIQFLVWTLLWFGYASAGALYPRASVATSSYGTSSQSGVRSGSEPIQSASAETVSSDDGGNTPTSYAASNSNSVVSTAAVSSREATSTSTTESSRPTSHSNIAPSLSQATEATSVRLASSSQYAPELSGLFNELSETTVAHVSSSHPDTTSTSSFSSVASASEYPSTTQSSGEASSDIKTESSAPISSKTSSSATSQSSGFINTQASTKSSAESSAVSRTKALSTEQIQTSSPLRATSEQESSTESGAGAQSAEESRTSSPIRTTSGQESTAEASTSALSTEQIQTSSPLRATSEQESSTESGAGAQSVEESRTSSPIRTTSGQESTAEASTSALSTEQIQTSSPLRATSEQESSTESGAGAQSVEESRTSSPIRTTSGQESTAEASTSALSTEQIQTSSPLRATSEQESSTESGAGAQSAEESRTSSPIRTTSGQESTAEASTSALSTEQIQTSSPLRATSEQESSTESGAGAQSVEESRTSSPIRTTSGQESTAEASTSALSTEQIQTSSPLRATSEQESSTESGAGAQSVEESRTSSPIRTTSGQGSAAEASARAIVETSNLVSISSWQASSTQPNLDTNVPPATKTSEQASSYVEGNSRSLDETSTPVYTFLTESDSLYSSFRETSKSSVSEAFSQTTSEASDTATSQTSSESLAGANSQSVFESSVQSSTKSPVSGTSSETRNSGLVSINPEVASLSSQYYQPSTSASASEPYGTAATVTPDDSSETLTSADSVEVSTSSPWQFMTEPQTAASSYLSTRPTDVVSSPITTFFSSTTTGSPLHSETSTSASFSQVVTPSPEGTSTTETSSAGLSATFSSFAALPGNGATGDSSSLTVSVTSQSSTSSFRTEDVTTTLVTSSIAPERSSSSSEQGVPTTSRLTISPDAATSRQNDQTAGSSLSSKISSSQPSYASSAPPYRSSSTQTVSFGVLTSSPGKVSISSSILSTSVTETSVLGGTDFSDDASLYSSITRSSQNPDQSGNFVTSSTVLETETTSGLYYVTSAYSELSVGASRTTPAASIFSEVTQVIISSGSLSPSDSIVLTTSESPQPTRTTTFYSDVDPSVIYTRSFPEGTVASSTSLHSASRVLLTSSLNQINTYWSTNSPQVTTRFSASDIASSSLFETPETGVITSELTSATASVLESTTSSLPRFVTGKYSSQVSVGVSKSSVIITSSRRYNPTTSIPETIASLGTTAVSSNSRSYLITTPTVSAHGSVSTESEKTSEIFPSTVATTSNSVEASTRLSSISYGSTQSVTRLPSSNTFAQGSSISTGTFRSSTVRFSASTVTPFNTLTSASFGLQTTSSDSQMPVTVSVNTKTQASRSSQHSESLTTALQPSSSQPETLGSAQPSRGPSLTTILAPSSTRPESSASNGWLPSNIVTASYAGSAHTQSSFDAGATATLPQVIVPPTPVSMPPNYSQITIGFKESLNYPFLIENPLASAQIFGFLPEILKYPFTVRASRSNSSNTNVKRDLANLVLNNRSSHLDELNWKSPIGNTSIEGISFSRNGTHNPFRANFSGVAVNSIVPLIVSGNDYITSIAVVYFPTEAVEILQKMIINGASRIYQNPDLSLRDMALLIDSKIPITGIISSDGSSQGGDSSGGSGSSNGSGGSGSSGSSSESSHHELLNNDNSGTLDGYKNFQVQFFTTKRLVIFLPVFIVAVAVWISLGLLLFGRLFRKESLQGMAGDLKKKWNTDQKTLDDYFGITHRIGKRQYADLEKNPVGSFHSGESSSEAFDDDDLLAVGNGMFFSKSTGLTYHVDHEGNFFYAGTADKADKPLNSMSTPKYEASNMVPSEEPVPKNSEVEEQSRSNGRSQENSGIEEIEVDEDGNVALSVSDLERLSFDEHNSDTIESYNNQQYYKMKQLLHNLNNDDIEGAFSTENEGAAEKVSSTGNESKLMPLSSESSKLLVQLSTDDDNLEEYFYSEEAQNEGTNGIVNMQSEPESEDNDDVEDFNIDSDSEDENEDVNDVHVGEFDELDEVMYRRFSSASGLTRFQGGSSSSNTFISLMQQRNSNMQPFSTTGLGSTSSEGYHGIATSDGPQTDSSNFASQSSPEDTGEIVDSKLPISSLNTKSAPKRPNRPTSIISLEKDDNFEQARPKTLMNFHGPKIQSHQKPSNSRETAGPSLRHESSAVERTQNTRISRKEKSRRSSFRKSMAETLHSANMFSTSTRKRSSTLNDVGPRGHTREELHKIRISGPIYSENSLG